MDEDRIRRGLRSQVDGWDPVPGPMPEHRGVGRVVVAGAVAVALIGGGTTWAVLAPGNGNTPVTLAPGLGSPAPSVLREPSPSPSTAPSESPSGATGYSPLPSTIILGPTPLPCAATELTVAVATDRATYVDGNSVTVTGTVTSSTNCKSSGPAEIFIKLVKGEGAVFATDCKKNSPTCATALVSSHVWTTGESHTVTLRWGTKDQELPAEVLEMEAIVTLDHSSGQQGFTITPVS